MALQWTLTFRVVAGIAAMSVAGACGFGGDDDVRLVTPDTAEAPPTGEPPDGSDPESSIERALFELTNDERRERGLEPLEWDEELAERAREWSRDMADEGRLEHQDVERMMERVEGYTGLGENIFRATRPVPASRVHRGWMRSDGHRANLLRDGFDRLGVGVLCTEDGELWATQRFGRTTAATGSLPTGGEPPPEDPIVAPTSEGPSCPRS